MKRIMILGASILQLPAIIKAKEMGIEVIAVDMDKNAIGFEYADVCLEISTIDIQKVLDAARLYNIDGIMTLASDMPMRTISKVSKELNIIGVSEDTALKATDKAVMRECLKENNVPIPKFFRVKNFEEYQNLLKLFRSKIIVKPADNSGSRGVYLLDSNLDNNLNKYAFEYSKDNSRSGEIVVEEYMEGPEVSVEALSIDGEIYIIAITDKLTTGAPKFVEMGHSQPSQLSNEIKQNIEDVAIKAIRAIGIKNGPSHTEIIVTKDGPKIVEIGARLGGDNITTHLVPLSTGIDLVKCCIEICLGSKSIIEKKLNKASVIRYLTCENGKISKITGIEEAKSIEGIKQLSIVKKVGSKINGINSSSDRVGFIISQADDINTAINICNKSKELIKISLEV